MFFVDDQYYDAAYFAAAESRFAAHAAISDRNTGRIAACFDDPAALLALCLHCKRTGRSFFPLPSGAPYEAALRSAKRAGCGVLLYKGIAAAPTLDGIVHDATGCLVQTSSGTTGEPKVITRTWADIDREIAGYAAGFKSASGMSPLVACPVNHSYGLISGVLASLARGAEPVVINNLNPKYVIRKMQEAERPLLYASPVLLHTVSLLYPRGKKLHAVMTSGTNIRQQLFDHLKERCDFVFQQYGCSEAGCVSVATDPLAPDDIGSPLPHLRVDAGMSSESPSEIVVVTNGRRVPTRDLGYFDTSGSLKLVSRIDDMINVAGINVYPVEVEGVISELSGVTDNVVFKQENSLGHTQVRLHYVSGGKVTPDEVRQWCATQLTPHQRPFHVEEVSEIPRLPNGKVNRREIAAQALRPASV